MSSPEPALVSARPRILVVYGTRPEAIKVAPIVWALARRSEVTVEVCSTGQHREMLAPVEAALGLVPDHDLDLMRPDQTLNDLLSRAVVAVDRVLTRSRPDWLVVQGDTTTAMAGALAAFHRRVRVAHVEAGLRTGDLGHPFPEEANRLLIDRLATLLFPPTARARDALLAEGVPAARMLLTGNTVVDALERIAAGLGPPVERDEVLVTVHRRESFGEPLARIFRAVGELARHFPETRFFYPVHRNPNVTGPARAALGGLPNVELAEPLDYVALVERLRGCRLVLTDSGGIQEEAPTFGKPVLVLRETTERPEGIEAGVAALVGTDPERIVATASRLLTDAAAYAAMARRLQPYGDGKAGERIAERLVGEMRSAVGTRLRDTPTPTDGGRLSVE